jgi:hypothetical protein
MEMDTDQERRSSPRVEFSGITLVHTLRREIYCVAGNISESGILLYPQHTSSAPSSPMRVTFALPVAPRWIELEGKLVRQTRVGVRTVWAVRFVDVPGEARQLLRQYATSSTSSVAVLPTPGPRVNTPAPVPAVKHKLSRTPPIERQKVWNELQEQDEPPPLPDDALIEELEPPPIPADALLEDPDDEPLTEPGTGRIPSEELEQLANSAGNHPIPTRRIAPEETAELKQRCRDLN